MANDLHLLSAVEGARAIKSGEIKSVDLVQACLDHIGDDVINAWAFLDADIALAQAREMDRLGKSGVALGALHGVPVGLKDIIDTQRMPTELGSKIYAGRQPEADAMVVKRLRQAGAVIIGKTKTTELAFMHPTDTLNPHNTAYSPGGSSSGSAAGVAACHVPLAIGSQTGGSVIRPASYSGVYGFKPSRGMISRNGALQTSVTLDHLGSFARSLDDIALLSTAISSYDPADVSSFTHPRPDFEAALRAELSTAPKIAYFDFPFHDLLDEDARQRLNTILMALDANITTLPVPAELHGLSAAHITIYKSEFYKHLRHIFETNWNDLSPTVQRFAEQGRKVSRSQYEDAQLARQNAQDYCETFFNEYDAIISPSSTGEAPLLSLGTTGDPEFCRIWSLTGLPAITLPLLTGDHSLPIGVQLIGGHEKDGHLLQVASWVGQQVRNNAD